MTHGVDFSAVSSASVIHRYFCLVVEATPNSCSQGSGAETPSPVSRRFSRLYADSDRVEVGLRRDHNLHSSIRASWAEAAGPEDQTFAARW